MVEGRRVKGISFTEEYENEYNRLIKEGNASQLVCELLRDHYNSKYGMAELECDIKYLRTDISYIKRKLENIGIV
ncbi:hypothetical protein [Romboutsia sp.]|uniref:hypothetical protein n=1 Tax=Romboutsia sp. TaxID=1965302 RepID=UPI002BF8924A|nr:hypothetical protein [Romboutsia sp.]HSQ88720.1 hypothetical protein [Romboutsia sp.]